MQNSTWKEYGDLIAPQDARTKDTRTPWTRILMNTWKNELNHEEPPWRTPVTKDDEIEFKDAKNKIKALRWFRWGFRRDGRGKWTPEKKRWKYLELEFIHQEQTPKKKDYSLGWNKNKIYCMLILHEI